MADYRLNEKGKNAETKDSGAGKVLSFMKEQKGVVNPSEISYEFDLPEMEAKSILDSLTKARFLERLDENKIK